MDEFARRFSVSQKRIPFTSVFFHIFPIFSSHSHTSTFFRFFILYPFSSPLFTASVATLPVRTIRKKKADKVVSWIITYSMLQAFLGQTRLFFSRVGEELHAGEIMIHAVSLSQIHLKRTPSRIVWSIRIKGRQRFCFVLVANTVQKVLEEGGCGGFETANTCDVFFPQSVHLSIVVRPIWFRRFRLS